MARLTKAQFYDRYTALIYEADTCRLWLEELARRARKNELLAKGNAVVRKEYGAELKEIVQAQRALAQAAAALELFRLAVHNIERATNLE